MGQDNQTCLSYMSCQAKVSDNGLLAKEKQGELVTSDDDLKAIKMKRDARCNALFIQR